MPIGTQSDSETELSIVTTLYYSAPYLVEFCRRVRTEAEKLTSHYEIILVNDGSPDSSLETALTLQNSNPKIRVIDLSRNFGQHKAMMTGLEHAQGRLVFLIDCDLEEAPELLTLFYSEMQKTDADVLYGVQSSRQGSYFRRISGILFYAIFDRLCDNPIPPNILSSRLMTRRYVRSLLEHRERELYMAGLWVITGYKQVSIEAVKRFKADSTYTFRKRLNLAVNAIACFSNTPLMFSFYFGAAIMLISGTAASVLVVRRIFFNVYLSGWSSLIVSIWLLGGMTIFFLGIIGIYLSKIFMETKQRPYTIVRHVYERKSVSESEQPILSDSLHTLSAPHLTTLNTRRNSQV